MDARRKRLKFRVWRRGFREIDLILGGFTDQHLKDLGEADLAAFEALLEVPDNDAYDWITGAAPAPSDHDTHLLAQLRAYRLTHAKPDA
jgi:antitoxin CptB